MPLNSTTVHSILLSRDGGQTSSIALSVTTCALHTLAVPSTIKSCGASGVQPNTPSKMVKVCVVVGEVVCDVVAVVV